MLRLVLGGVLGLLLVGACGSDEKPGGDCDYLSEEEYRSRRCCGEVRCSKDRVCFEGEAEPQCVAPSCPLLSDCCFSLPDSLRNDCENVVAAGASSCSSKLDELHAAGYCTTRSSGVLPPLCNQQGTACDETAGGGFYFAESCCDDMVCYGKDAGRASACTTCLGIGERCDVSGKTGSPCCQNTHCGDSQTCEALGSLGESCRPVIDPCSFGLECEAGKCVKGATGGAPGSGSASTPSCDPSSCKGSMTSCSADFCFSCFYSCSGGGCVSTCN